MTDERDDDRVSLEGLDPVAALKALLAVDPAAPPVDADDPEPRARPAEPHDPASEDTFAKT